MNDSSKLPGADASSQSCDASANSTPSDNIEDIATAPIQHVQTIRKSVADNVQSKTTPSFVRIVTSRLMDLVTTELHTEDNQKRLHQHIIRPLIRMLYTQMMPYLLIMCAVMFVILLTSLCTCTMFALFFFRTRIKVTTHG